MKNENLITLVNIIKSFSDTNTIPVLDGIKIKNGIVTVTDLGIMVEVNMDLKHDGVINKKLFCSTVTSIKDFKIKVDPKGNYTFYNSSEKVQIGGYNIEEYPDPMIKSDHKKTVIGELGPSEMKYLSIASNFVGTDTLRPVLNWVYYKDDVVGTDAHRIYWQKVKTPFKNEVRFPARVCKLFDIIGGAFEVAQHGDNIVSCTNGDYVISFRTAEGNYPNYNAVIPRDFKYTIELNVAELKDIVSKVIAYADQKTHQLKMSIDGDKLLISGEDLDFNNSYKAQITPILVKNNLENTKMVIGVNAIFMIHVLKNIEEETVTIKMIDPNMGITLNDGFLLMPVALH